MLQIEPNAVIAETKNVVSINNIRPGRRRYYGTTELFRKPFIFAFIDNHYWAWRNKKYFFHYQCLNFSLLKESTPSVAQEKRKITNRSFD